MIIVFDRPLDIIGIVNSPSLATINKAEFINPSAKISNSIDIVRSNIFRAVRLAKLSERFLKTKYSIAGVTNRSHTEM